MDCFVDIYMYIYWLLIQLGASFFFFFNASGYFAKKIKEFYVYKLSNEKKKMGSVKDKLFIEVICI